jgi:membrane-associated phospholipid phosphatase
MRVRVNPPDGVLLPLPARLCRLASIVLLACAVSPGARPARAQEAFPYELDPWLDGGLSAGAAIALAGSVAVYRGQEPFTEEEVAALDPADVNPFDRSATQRWSPTAGSASDVLTWTLLAAPAGVALATPGARRPLTIGAMYAEVLLLNVSLVQLLKGLTERARPYAYNDDPDIPVGLRLEVEARRSLPSSHAANAFAAAVFLSSVYARLHPGSAARKWVWAGSLTAAGLVGYLRYEAGQHFPTDVIVGAILGAGVGYIVPKLHESRVVDLAIGSAGGDTVVGLRVRY